MASSTRQDRALMRQRGAGSRIVANADFGLNFGVGESREERQQMRQRGARSRMIGNVDFGLSFPSSARSLRSSTSTPQSRKPSSRQSSKTPGRRSQEPSSPRSTRESSTKLGENPEEPAQSEVAESEAGGRSTKRRRLSESITASQNLSLGEIPNAVASSRASRKRKSSNVFTIAEDEDARESDRISRTGKSIPPERQTSPLFFSSEGFDEENTIPDNVNPQTEEQITKLDDLKATRRTARSSTKSVLSTPVGWDEGGNDQTEAEEEAGQNESSKIERVKTAEIQPSLLELDEPGPSKQKRRKKRKSVNLGPKKRKSSGRTEINTSLRESSIQDRGSRAPSEDPSSLSVVPSAGRIGRSSRAGSTHNETDDAESDGQRSPREAEDEDETYIQESSPEPQTPANALKASQRSRHRTASDGKTRAPKHRESKPTFPILTHRLTNIPTLPTITEDSEDKGHDRPDGASNLHYDRSQPNAVDVLAQICRETIETMIERLSHNGQPSERQTLKIKRDALEAFARDIDDDFFEMSEAVENRINLEGQVRKSKREKSALQTEWIELRKERERIALKCDAVRRRHWESEEDAREKWNLSEAARRVEIEMERDDQDDHEGIEYLLRSVVGDVSNVSDQGGILDRIRSFNAQLESMALFLEGKEV
ncbi:uncharacterized protein Z518_10303 [Rhinocladiella mackenziei CBS 650.93]|uniref:Inner kinetochore subunit AME1 domain-containing protein n=1 Tax=Rhinocladiella mackenziei CBS 650.93 TaxID=1442369 RepID=A0A0D2IA91_9EURO|nr:uncharacterized protein Z518_10303 [Rhinocladiella mackenziei CBS 650.93]KIX00166.1 hypothetical protein Z518_10303 [Rhinocladiella mackenziei CBS 650.93]